MGRETDTDTKLIMSGAQQPVLHASQGMSMSFRGIGTTTGSPLPPEASSSSFSPHAVNVGTPTVLPVGPAEPVKRKRGRPRNYGPPNGSVSLSLSSALISTTPKCSSVGPMQSRGRGRPRGSGGKKQMVSTGILQTAATAGVGFTPHVITVAVGEDVATKIMSFAHQCLRAVTVLSSTGSVSTVTLRQSTSSGGSITYEGRFEILCLSGLLLPMDNTMPRNRIGDLSISLASPDGRVIGGSIGGLLIAATPVQIVVGSFSWGNSKSKNEKHEGLSAISSSSLAIQWQNPTSNPPGQKLSNVPVGLWPDDSQHIDIDASI